MQYHSMEINIFIKNSNQLICSMVYDGELLLISPTQKQIILTEDLIKILDIWDYAILKNGIYTIELNQNEWNQAFKRLAVLTRVVNKKSKQKSKKVK